jgi:hypothetical protein
MLTGLRKKEYGTEPRLRELELTTLEKRRHQADMHTVHRIRHAENGLDPKIWFEKAGGAAHAKQSGADPYNIKAKTERLESMRQFFTERVISDWNRMPAEIKACPGAGGFKASYKKIRERTAHPA